MTAHAWLRIYFGQLAALQRREALAIGWLRLSEQCRAEAATHLASARQAAELAAQAARQYARLAPGPVDDFEGAVAGLLSELDERDNGARLEPVRRSA